MLAAAVAIGAYVRTLAGMGQLIGGADSRNSTGGAKAEKRGVSRFDSPLA